jgi:hypothetical protein
MNKVHDDTLRAGKIFGQANANYAKGNVLSKDSKFFQNGPSVDGWVPPSAAGRSLSAPPPGEEDPPAKKTIKK